VTQFRLRDHFRQPGFDDPPVLKKAFDTPGPVLVGVQVDYRDNRKLFEKVSEDSIN
jgi:hypothetical protein